MKKIFFVFIAFLGFYSCEDTFTTVLNVDPPEYVKRMAVHAFFDASDTELKVAVATTVGLLERANSLSKIDDAQVEIYVDGEKVGDMVNDSGFSNSPNNYFLVLPKPIGDYGEELEIKITHPDFDQVSAKDKFPKANIPLNLKFINNAGIIDGGDPAAGIEIEFQDNASLEEFYEIGVIGIEVFPSQDSNFYSIYSTSLDPAVEMGANSEDILVNDITFDGNKYRLLVTFAKWSIGETLPLGLRWNNVSKGQYLYSKSIGNFNNARETAGPFATPVSIYTNMENGLGVLGLRRGTYFNVER